MQRLLRLAAIVTTLAACSTGRAAQPSPHVPAQRIVTLVPSFAEDVCAVGARSQLVAVSAYTDAACAAGLPAVNNFSSVNTEKIVALRTDVVLALPAQRALTTGLVRANIPVVYIGDDAYGDIFGDLLQIGAIAGRSANARALVASLKAQDAALRRRAHYAHRPTVVFVEQASPLWTVGPASYIATLISRAGGRIATTDLHRAYAQYSDEALLRANPDVIVATADAHVDQVLGREPWRSLRAVRQHHVFVDKDSNALVRPSPHYLAGLQWLIARFSSL